MELIGSSMIFFKKKSIFTGAASIPGLQGCLQYPRYTVQSSVYSPSSQYLSIVTSEFNGEVTKTY